MEQIFIDKLRVFGYHGVYEQEKSQGQTFVVDCICDVSFAEAVQEDALSQTTDYGNVCLFIKKYFDEHAYDLLETAADGLSTALMYAFPGMQRLELSISKPEAPIPMEFKGVGVRMTKAWIPVAISFGSNIGDREAYLTEAMEKLVANPAIRNLVVSDYIETEPYGYREQDKFLNGAAIFETLLSPEELLALFQSMEQEAGRRREIHWGPRTLDLDILLYGDRQVNQKNLIIPHIDMCNRSFVLQPLMQIAPGMVHPIRRRTIYDLYHMLQK
jgi:dihydroneopterin aldolase/2-amino-4-hydroxy-6-hydroxymethyldihydropteridine diphosphokinase